MNNIDTRPPFFPRTKANQTSISKPSEIALKRNDASRMKELENNTAKDAKVSIADTIKDFSRIKKAVDASGDVDNSDKIAKLRAQIQAKTYDIDYDALADKMLTSEF